jgi:hypothetical protein
MPRARVGGYPRGVRSPPSVEGQRVSAQVVSLGSRSPFSIVEPVSTWEIDAEAPVHYLLVSGKQDDGVWGPVGAIWLSEDARRGGFLVHPWGLFEGSEFVRGYRSAIKRGWVAESIYRYWQREVWRGTYAIDRERRSETLRLLNDLLASL